MLSAILWGGFAATSMLVGFYLSSRGLSNRTVGLIMGLGSGTLLSIFSLLALGISFRRPDPVCLSTRHLPGIGSVQKLIVQLLFSKDRLS